MPGTPSGSDWGPKELDAEANRIAAGMLRFKGRAALEYFKVELAKIPGGYQRAIETMILAKESTTQPKPDLTDSLIILLISAAITIFIFWISSQYLGQENFARLPDWIVGTYKGIWSSVVTGTVGIGAALLKAFTSRARPQPHYLKYIGITTGCLFVPIVIIVAAPAAFPQIRGRKQIQPPTGVARVNVNSAASTDFDLEAEPQNPVTYVLKGSFIVENRTLKGHLASGKVTVAKDPPKSLSSAVNRISFQVCYLDPTNGDDLVTVYPGYSGSRDSIEVNLPLRPGASYDLPAADFAFDLPKGKPLDRAWLCAALWNGSDYFRAQ
jgi:hypothetical protein